jgi:hypothetical protein
MAKRKETPDVLAQVLGGPPSEAASFPKAGIGAIVPEAWEYQVISLQDYRGWRPRFRNGQEIKDWTNAPVLHDLLEAMGEDGWELAAASAGERLNGTADTHQHYFKRRLNPE